jgi:hypothetical protein
MHPLEKKVIRMKYEKDRIESKLGPRIVIPINPGKFEIGMRSRSDPQNMVIFRIAAIHDPIRQKPAFKKICCPLPKIVRNVF